jgi:hypothetical protein
MKQKQRKMESIRVSGWGNKVEKGVHSIVPEARITLDARFFGQNVVILTFKVSDDLLEAVTRRSQIKIR